MVRQNKPKKRESTVKSYKHTVWGVVAKYIKARDANDNGECKCCTCDKPFRYNDPKLHAGHFVSGRGNNVLFDDAIIHAQCYFCNVRLHGNVWKYGEFMQRKYGYDYETLKEIQQRKKVVKKFTLEDLKEIKQHFEKLLAIELKRLNAA
jgi:hypothetical protein